ncbi:MAG: HlyD family secretion protein [Anaerolineales bacterium]
MSKHKRFALIALITVFILSACGTAAEETSPPEAVPVDLPPIVSATGEVVPSQEALLSVTVGGVVQDVLVEKGDPISVGQVLVRMEGSEQQKAAVSAAELELANAQFALESLNNNTDLLAAQALKSAENAERALEDLNNPDLQQAEASQVVTEAEKAVDVAERKLEILTKPASQSALDQAQANILMAQKKYDDIIEQIEDIRWQHKKFSSNAKLPAEIRNDILTKLKRALKGLEVIRSQEELSLIDSKSRYNELLSPPDPIDVQVAEANLATAKAQLSNAQRELQRVLDGPQPGEVALLEAQIEKGYRDYDTFSVGPDPDDVAIAEARLTNAEAQLAAAQAAIADRELVAPYDGVISAIYINPNEWVAPGSPVLLIGDLEHLQVQTTDLGEIDVAQISLGDRAAVTFDALPELALEGTVVSIAPKADEGSGVNFPVTIELEDIPAELRWGMTAFIDIELE